MTRALFTDTRVAWVAATATGAGLIFVLSSMLSGSMPGLVVGGALSASGLLLLVAAGWIDPIAPLLLASPLPALTSGGGVRVAAVAPVAAVVCFAVALAWGVRRGRIAFGALPVRLGLGLIVWWLVASALSPFPATAARETANFLVLVGVVLVALDHFRRRPGSMRAAARWLTVVAAVVGVLALLEAVTILPGTFPRFGTPYFRAALGFGQPNALGLFLALATPLAALEVGTAPRGPRRLVAVFLLVAVLLGLAATFSRGSWFSVVAAIPVLALAGQRRAALRLLLASVLVIAAVDLMSGGMVRDTVERTVGDWIVEQRAALALAGIAMASDHPVVGVGPGGYEHSLDFYAGALPQLVEDLPTPHNAYVQMAAETGLPGLLLYVMFLGAALWAAVRAVRDAPPDEIGLRSAVLWSLAAVAWASMFVWPLAHGPGEAVAVVLAMAVSGQRESTT